MGESPANQAPPAAVSSGAGPTHESVLLRVLIAVGMLCLLMYSGLLDGRRLATPWFTLHFDRGLCPLALSVFVAFVPDLVRFVRTRKAAAVAAAAKKVAAPRNPFDVMIEMLRSIQKALTEISAALAGNGSSEKVAASSAETAAPAPLPGAGAASSTAAAS